MDVTQTVDGYMAMWNEADPARRAEGITAVWDGDARYVDPLLEARGHAELGAMVDGVQAQFPGHRFRRSSGIDVHHDVSRLGWELAAPDVAVVSAGIDFAVLGPGGRLRTVAGFFGELPADEG